MSDGYPKSPLRTKMGSFSATIHLTFDWFKKFGNVQSPSNDTSVTTSDGNLGCLVESYLRFVVVDLAVVRRF